MFGSLFIVWRESVEALLVIGILYAWINQNNLQQAKSKLWLGVGLGLILTFVLALAFWLAGNWISGVAGDWLFFFMMVVAGLLILQMVIWMHRHGRNMKSHLEKEASTSLKRSGGFGLALIALVAVAREGAEIIVFLYGQAAASFATSSTLLFITGAVLGLALGLVTFFILQFFSNAIPWKWFFRVSEFILLMLGGAMMVSAVDRLYQILPNYEVPEFVYELFDTPIWSTAWLIPDNSTLAGLTGYRAEPSIIQFSILFLYWLTAILLCRQSKKHKTVAHTV